MEIREYVAKNGKTPYREWVKSLDYSVRARIDTRLIRLEESGNIGKGRALKHGIYELKFDIGGGVRVYYGMDGHNLIILLIGGNKQRQDHDIEKATEYWRDYLANREEE